MKATKAAERIAEACLGIIRRSDQIVALAETSDAELSRIFSGKEIRVTNGICCELALSVADSRSRARRGWKRHGTRFASRRRCLMND